MKQSDYLFFDWICLLFACPDKDRTSQNGPLDPVFGPPRGRGDRQKWSDKVIRVVRCVIKPLKIHTMP